MGQVTGPAPGAQFTESLYREAIAVRERLMKLFPTEPDHQSKLAGTLHNMAMLFEVRGSPDVTEYRALLRSAIEIQRRALAVRPQNSSYRRFLANHLQALTLSEIKDAEGYLKSGDTTKADEAWRRIVDRYERVIAELPDERQFQLELGRYWGNWAVAQVRMNKCLEALCAMDRAANFRSEPHEFLVLRAHCLTMVGRYKEAEPIARRAVELRPKDSDAQRTFGQALLGLNRLEESLQPLQHAIELRPDGPNSGSALAFLGRALVRLERFEESVLPLRRAIEIKPTILPAYHDLGHALRQLGQLPESLAVLRAGQEQSRKLPGKENSFAERVAEAEWLFEVETKLPRFLSGEVVPANVDEQVAIALVCYWKKRYLTAVRYFDVAFAVEPKLLKSPDSRLGEKAACCAALACANKGIDTSEIDDAERARLRKKCSAWLGADLAVWQEVAADANKRVLVRLTLSSWQRNPEFANVRDPEELGKLSDSEKLAWRKLWTDVATVLGESQTEGLNNQ